MNQRDVQLYKTISTNRRLRKRLLIVRKKLQQRELGYAALVETNLSLAKQLGDLKFLNDFSNYHKTMQDSINSMSIESERKEQNAINYALNIQTKLSKIIQSCKTLSDELNEVKNQTGTYLNSISSNHKPDVSIYEPSSSVESSLNCNSNITNTCINGYHTPSKIIQNGNLELTPPNQNQMLLEENQTKMSPPDELRLSLEEPQVANLPQKEAPIDHFTKELNETSALEDNSDFFLNEDAKSVITDIGHGLLSDSSSDESDVDSVILSNQIDTAAPTQQELDIKEPPKTPPFRRFPIRDHNYAQKQVEQCFMNVTLDKEVLSPVIDSSLINKLSDVFIDEELQSEFANRIKQGNVKRKNNSFSQTIEKKLCSDPFFTSDMSIRLTPLSLQEEFQKNSMNNSKVQEEQNFINRPKVQDEENSMNCRKVQDEENFMNRPKVQGDNNFMNSPKVQDEENSMNSTKDQDENSMNSSKIQDEEYSVNSPKDLDEENSMYSLKAQDEENSMNSIKVEDEENSINSHIQDEETSDSLGMKNLCSVLINASKINTGLCPVMKIQDEFEEKSMNPTMEEEHSYSLEIKNLFSEHISTPQNISEINLELEKNGSDKREEISNSIEINTNGTRSPLLTDSDVEMNDILFLPDKQESNKIFHTYIEKKKISPSRPRPRRYNIYTSPDQMKEFNLYNLKSPRKRRNKIVCSTHVEFQYNNDPVSRKGFHGFTEQSSTSAMLDRHKLLRYLRKIK